MHNEQGVLLVKLQLEVYCCAGMEQIPAGQQGVGARALPGLPGRRAQRGLPAGRGGPPLRGARPEVQLLRQRALLLLRLLAGSRLARARGRASERCLYRPGQRGGEGRADGGVRVGDRGLRGVLEGPGRGGHRHSVSCCAARRLHTAGGNPKKKRISCNKWNQSPADESGDALGLTATSRPLPRKHLTAPKQLEHCVQHPATIFQETTVRHTLCTHQGESNEAVAATVKGS